MQNGFLEYSPKKLLCHFISCFSLYCSNIKQPIIVTTVERYRAITVYLTYYIYYCNSIIDKNGVNDDFPAITENLAGAKMETVLHHRGAMSVLLWIQ